MKLLRIKLNQSQAHYGRPEQVGYKSTYPLPSYSTIIGFLHAACGYREYHPMNISVQGKYDSISINSKRYENMLNRIEDDRGELIYRPNPNISKYIKVAKALTDAKRERKVSFLNKSAIEVYNHELLDYYIKSKRISEQYSLNYAKIEFLEKILLQIKNKQNNFKIDTKEFGEAALKKLTNNDCIRIEEKEKTLKNKNSKIVKEYYLKNKEKMIEVIEFALEYKKFATMQTNIVKVETLNNVELVIHVQAEDKVLQDLMKYKNGLVNLGRSEDWIHLREIEFVDATEKIEKEYHLTNEIQMFINRSVLKEMNGTVYYLDKNYQIVDNKRQFIKVPVLLTSEFSIKEKTDGILVDGEYIINLN